MIYTVIVIYTAFLVFSIFLGFIFLIFWFYRFVVFMLLQQLIPVLSSPLCGKLKVRGQTYFHTDW